MLGLSRGQIDVLIITTAFKLLLYPAYRSTDFEVHRNWLAITHHLPWRQWYYDTTSEWTLDYPPFFAYFSYLLTLPARLLPRSSRDHLLTLSTGPVEGWDITAYMRTTVLLTELVLLLGLLRLAKSSVDSHATFTALAIFLHPGFLILDNLHFQYNAFLFGIMVWSLVGARERRPVLCAGPFTALLMFKHIYVYLAPAWFIYLLRAYCIPPSSGLVLHLKPLIAIGATTVAVFAVALGPFVLAGQGPQLLLRLFPFTRGLMHAYWAPNAWTGVTLLDRILLQVSKRLHLTLALSKSGIASTSRGLVGDTHFAVLPDILPVHCFALTVVTQLIQLVPLWRRPSYPNFLKAIAACGFSSFMFGWHVHEKAVMLVLVPLSLLAHEDGNMYRAFEVASVAGIISLFPLLFKVQETPVKFGYTVIWAAAVARRLGRSVPPPSTLVGKLFCTLQRVYILSSVPLLLMTSIVHPALTLAGHLGAGAEFLPLMLTSVWCSVGMWVSWSRLQAGLWGMPKVDVKLE
ncbi:glycosyl transferase [Cryptotrichosporon argae]